MKAKMKKVTKKKKSKTVKEITKTSTVTKIQEQSLERGTTFMKCRANVDMWIHSMKSYMKLD